MIWNFLLNLEINENVKENGRKVKGIIDKKAMA